ncbi:hydroxypyruvate isomerase [Nitrincola alkalilacustris]|uniref:hydroxypyruvate isomerase n=1 Tax=Nitrincola alkalilacustris TaxID=1571224 RepID=UPI00124DA406|nr:hydroxypyruvate isomerase [Nitrincola alkalilacustris]
MLKFAANLTMLFNEVEFTDRFAAAAKAGFKGVEYLFPYDWSAQQLADLLAENGLQQVLHNLPAGDWAGGERGIACHPDRVAEFRDGVGKAIEYAKTLGCPQVNCLAGIAPQNVRAETLQETFVENLRFAAAALAAENIRLLIEPINTFDIPGFYLNRTAQASEIIDQVGSSNLFIQYDIYHAQRMEGELINTMQKYWDRIAHLQLADNPGRNEPGTGEINYRYLFEALRQKQYDGWIGCEYKPAGTTEAGLGWIEALNS